MCSTPSHAFGVNLEIDAGGEERTILGRAIYRSKARQILHKTAVRPDHYHALYSLQAGRKGSRPTGPNTLPPGVERTTHRMDGR